MILSGRLTVSDSQSASAAPAAGESIETLISREGLRLERIVSRGDASPPGFWYDQDEHEWVLLVSGRARLQFDSEPAMLELEPGDWVQIPARARHRVAWTDPRQPTVWLALYYPAGAQSGTKRFTEPGSA